MSAAAARPFLDLEPLTSLRDPALVLRDGVWSCFHTAVENRADGYALFVDVVRSTDLIRWSVPRRLTQPPLNFSSPGNALRVDRTWQLCLQSYPLEPGEPYGSDDSRLWLMASPDLERWEPPRLLQPSGCVAAWAVSRRQIDPYLVEHDGRFWCFYKTDGQLGLLVSDDLENWAEACPERPVLSNRQTPDRATVENPCVVRDDDGFVLFFSPVRNERGIGIARSDDLLVWRDVQYLDVPPLEWAPGGPTAAMVVDTRPLLGCWTMAFHGDRIGPHGAALGMAWSEDLVRWEFEQPPTLDSEGSGPVR